MSQQESNKSSLTDFKTFVNITTAACHVLSVAVNVFLHLAPGERYIGMVGLLIIPVLALVGGLTEPQGGAALVAIVPFYFLMCVFWHQYAVFRRKRLRRLVHTRYSGRPWLCFLLPRLNELTVKRIEPGLVFLAGALISMVNHPLGLFLIIAALGQAMSLSIQHMIALGRELDEMDSRLEQQDRAERSRELFGQ